MAEVDLRQFEGDVLVLHFGGLDHSVDIHTLGDALSAFGDFLEAVSRDVEPEEIFEFRIEALADGSLRTLIRRVPKPLRRFLQRGAENLLWAFVAWMILERGFAPTDTVTVVVDEQNVVVRHNEDTIIVPRTVHEQTSRLKNNEAIAKSLDRTFRTVERDSRVTSLGVSPSSDYREPLIVVPRESFATEGREIPLSDTRVRRVVRPTHARLVVLKLWLRRGDHKWSLEWNGVPVSARISDANFLRRLFDRELLIGAGDALDVVLSYEQVWDETLGIYINDPSTFDILEVVGVIPRGGGTQDRLPGF